MLGFCLMFPKIRESNRSGQWARPRLLPLPCSYRARTFLSEGVFWVLQHPKDPWEGGRMSQGPGSVACAARAWRCHPLQGKDRDPPTPFLQV